MIVMMVRHYLSILLAMNFLISASAQNEDVVTGAGGNNVNGNLSLKWTIGSTVTSRFTAREKKAVQPQRIPDKSVITAAADEYSPGIILLYPNPAGDILNIQFDSPTTADMNMILLDSRGNQEKNIPVESSVSEKQVSLHNIPSGVYYIRMVKEDIVKIYKVVKL